MKSIFGHASMAWGARNLILMSSAKIVCYPHDGKGGPKVASAYIELARRRGNRVSPPLP